MKRYVVFTTFGPWEDERDYRQELWCHQWNKQEDAQVFVLNQGFEKTARMCSRYGFVLVNDIKKASSIGLKADGLLMSSMFKEIEEYLRPEIKYVAYVGDCLPLTPYIGEIIECCSRISGGRFQFFIRGRDFPNWAYLCKPTFDETIKRFEQTVMRKGHVHFPGIDTFIWSRDVFSEMTKVMPDMNFLYGGSERWWLNYCFNGKKIVNYELTGPVCTIHLQHPTAFHRLPKDRTDDPSKSADNDYLHNFKFIPKTLEEVWDKVEATPRFYDNGLSYVEWVPKLGEQKDGCNIKSTG